MNPNSRGLHRRQFLRVATLGVGALGIDATGMRAAFAAEDSGVRETGVQSYRKLGRTGLEVSDISFGSGDTKDPELVRYALDRGVTYFDTAESYPMFDGGKAEVAIGRGLQGKRDKVILGSKTIAEARDRRGVLMRRLEASLRRLRTDYIDLYFNHAVNEPARLRNPEWFEFVDLAKKQGKIRFSGMSGHGGRLIECLNIAVEGDLVDVMLVAHNFGQDPKFYEKFTKHFDLVANQKGLPDVMTKARAKGIGVLTMKTLMGAKLNEMRPYEFEGSTYAQAAFRWVLSSENVDGVVISMKSRALIDEYLGGSGRGAVRESDVALLDRYFQARTGEHCRQGCDACESSCPEDVPISEVLRTRMYAADYGEVENARASYARLGAGAQACLSCAHQSCAGSCPWGLDVPSRTRDTHRMLGRS